MLSILSSTPTLPLLEKVAAFAERRQDVLAGNMANISTPGYRTRDLPVSDFQEAMRQAVSLQRQPSSVSTPESLFGTWNSRPQSTAELFPQELFQAVERAPQQLTFQDASNRSIEDEVMEMTKNSMMQNFAIELMAAQMNLLQAVISERP